MLGITVNMIVLLVIGLFQPHVVRSYFYFYFLVKCEIFYQSTKGYTE